jgi:hypothetical protein
MNLVCRQLALSCAVLFIFTSPAAAKRAVPEPVVPPVISGGVRYAAEGDARNQYVVAVDVSSGNVLWKARIFHNRIKLWMDICVQWVYIADLKLVGNSLFVRDEKSRCYSIELARRHVTQRQCGDVFSQ